MNIQQLKKAFYSLGGQYIMLGTRSEELICGWMIAAKHFHMLNPNSRIIRLTQLR